MKTYIFILIIFLPGFFSCTSLEEEPMGVYAPESFFTSAADVEAAVFGAYGLMASEPFWGRKLSLPIMLLSDMVDIGNPGTPTRRVQINDFTSDAYNGMVSEFWPRSYMIISAANTAISGAESLDNISDEERNALIAEAKFARALVYFDLVRLFGDIPYIGKAINDPESLIDISKTSAQEVYNSIMDDLEFGVDYLPDQQISRARASRASAAAMLADVHLTLGNWNEAYNNAKWVIDNATKLDVSLEPDYQVLFDASQHDGQKEHIFVIDFLGLQSGTEYWEGDDLTGPLTGVGGGSDMAGWDVAVPSLNVYNSFDDRDYRKQVAFVTETTFSGELKPYTEWQFPRPYIAKYTRYPGKANNDARWSDCNYAIYRYADVLLMAAEAGNEVSGPNAELEGYVNQVRERARNAAGVMNDFPENVSVGMSKDEFRDMVLEERRIELCFEFKRWWDISRRKLGDQVFKGANSLEPHENFDAGKDYLLALPQDELDRNPNLKPQNPGYN
ncbi:MAG: RagB/SusD family nutrient uptake outer membrane protein [Bacteroidota bacterium]